ncbi:ComEC family protein [Erwinia tracheiphila]|uniref:ComEC family protein n=1 Tax=Erwinia tracheiphila TaxID=65700 RepID=A0A345CRZ9_9GAMM|nr:ComEC family protein [Erwinia tracheiphila]AXF76216.1 ComEC family protein [Erwinia tracheiphila]UIA85119.1 ComEC family protein [Erwinia tracheiphila]UIA93720.1 ComEC family protein [Erwinia tracheiphila]
MPYSLSRLAMWVIIATLPLNMLPHLPDAKYDWWFIAGAMVLRSARARWLRELAIPLLLFIWVVSPARILLQQTEAFTARPLEATVQIEHVQSERMTLRVVRVSDKMIFPPVRATVSLPDHDVSFCAGQRWKMRLKLRVVHARLNEGGFDSQKFSVANAVPMNGKILAFQSINTDCGLRHHIIVKSKENYGNLAWHAILSALAFGERGDIDAVVNQLLRETGTAHLMAISGMHISLAASFGWLLTRVIQLFFPVHWVGYRFPLISGLLVAVAYTWLSGWGPPSVRAIVALSVWGILRLRGICCSNWQVWRICIGFILFFDPLSILSDSLWLSAMAVAGLLFWYHWFPLPQRFAAKKRWLLLQLLHLQLAIFLLLMPLQIQIFHGISISALIANLWAVPLVTFLTVPLILSAIVFTLFTPVSQFFWWLADKTLLLVFTPLATLPAGWLQVSYQALWFSAFVWMLVVAGRLGWLRSSPASLLALCIAFYYWHLSVRLPEWRVDMLDIGHGLSVIISRDGKAVVYDTGNRWEGGDEATRQILPWLKWQGLEVQQIILSHNHLDHTGGLESLQKAFPDTLLRSETGRGGHLPCHRGIKWRWQSINFEVLWPVQGEALSVNNQSCVIMVSDGKWRVLLTGDLESLAELKMVSRYRSDLKADVLQVPHHGSGTSSSPPFLRAVEGSVALASVARYNAWKLPAERVIQRYKDYRYRWFDTARDGQISVQFFSSYWQVEGLRAQILPRWYHQWFGVPRYSR